MISPRQALRNWCRFHRRVLPVVDSLMIATFDQVTLDFGRMADRANALFEHKQANVDDCFRAVEVHNGHRFGGGQLVEMGVARPSVVGNATNNQIMTALDTAPLQPFLACARTLYGRYAELATSANAEAPSVEPVRADG